jgi:hypothetical protein
VGITDRIEFDHQRLWGALAYHIDDDHGEHWEFCDVITPDSFLHLEARLRRERRRASVLRFHWSHMTNKQRLTWLLDVAGTEGRLITGTRTYELVRKSRPKAGIATSPAEE